jgi:hypothetical protein
MVLAIAKRSIASRWLTQRKSPGKFCRHAAVSALPGSSPHAASSKFIPRNQILIGYGQIGTALA